MWGSQRGPMGGSGPLGRAPKGGPKGGSLRGTMGGEGGPWGGPKRISHWGPMGGFQRGPKGDSHRGPTEQGVFGGGVWGPHLTQHLRCPRWAHRGSHGGGPIRDTPGVPIGASVGCWEVPLGVLWGGPIGGSMGDPTGGPMGRPMEGSHSGSHRGFYGGGPIGVPMGVTQNRGCFWGVFGAPTSRSTLQMPSVGT